MVAASGRRACPDWSTWARVRLFISTDLPRPGIPWMSSKPWSSPSSQDQGSILPSGALKMWLTARRASGAGRLTGSRRSASDKGASAGSAVPPQQKPGTEAAKASRGSPTRGGEHALAPALGDLLQTTEPARELVLAFLRLHPGQHPEAQPHHGPGRGVVLGEGAHGIAHGAAVGMGEGHERGGGARHGGAEAAQPAALDQNREAAGEAGLGEALP